MSYAVRVWFRERGELVYDDLGPFDRFIAEHVILSMRDGHLRAGRVVHVERAIIVKWLDG